MKVYITSDKAIRLFKYITKLILILLIHSDAKNLLLRIDLLCVASYMFFISTQFSYSYSHCSKEATENIMV